MISVIFCVYLLQYNDCETELGKIRERLSVMESDLHAAESERDSLTKKVHLLERAIDSPNSRVALRRLLERYHTVHLYMYHWIQFLK